MSPNRLSLLALSAFSLFLFACPAPVDNQEGMAGGSGGSSSGGSSGRGGSGTGGSTGGSSSSGGSTGGSSSSGGSTGGSSASGGTGGSGTGGSGTGGTGGSGTGGSAGSTGGTSGTGGSGTGGSAGSTGGTGGGMTDAKAEAPAAAGNKLPPAIATIFMARCGTCHNSEYNNPTMAYTRLKGMAGAPCSRARMTPGMGSMSLVVLAMKGMKPCGTNMKMPPGNAAAVPMADITAVEEWITAGAMGVP